MFGHKVMLIIMLTATIGSGVQAAPSKKAGGGSAGGKDKTPPTISVPADIIAEATGAAGAQIYYTISVTDDKDRSPSVTCTTSSGSIFPLGVTIVDCTATDRKGNSSSDSFEVSVVDTTIPALTIPENITMAAANSNGAVVSYSVSAKDTVDASVTTSCIPASGSVFPLGDTLTNCIATDSYNNQASGNFLVTVNAAMADEVPPALTLPENIQAEATQAEGTQVSFDISASDEIDGNVEVNCLPGSASMFPLGDTLVRCESFDNSGNRSEGTFNVSVVDTLAPLLNLPENTMETIDTEGLEYTYNVSVNDVVDPSPSMQCLPASGSWFVVGETTVVCQATDSSGNLSSGDFLVTLLQSETTPPEDDSTDTNGTKSIQITWDSPVTREDGESMSVDEIGGYQINLSGELVGNENLIIIDDPLATYFNIENLVEDSYLITISAVDTSGLISNPSNTLSIFVQ